MIMKIMMKTMYLLMKMKRTMMMMVTIGLKKVEDDG
jgi:hypothetical protein